MFDIPRRTCDSLGQEVNVNNHNDYPTREKIKDAIGVLFLMGMFYALWVLVAVIEPH